MELKDILDKAKELATSETVTGAVEKVKDAAVSTGLKDVYEKSAERAKSFGSATKLTVELNRDHKELERIFSEIGKLYYEQCSGLGDGFFAPLFEQAEKMKEAIREKERKIEEYKASFGGSGMDAAEKEELNGDIADFESIVNQTENDGTSI